MIIFNYKKDQFGWKFKINLSFYKGKILNYDLLDQKMEKYLFQKEQKLIKKHIRDLEK